MPLFFFLITDSSSTNRYPFKLVDRPSQFLQEAHFELHPRICCNKFVARSGEHVTLQPGRKTSSRGIEAKPRPPNAALYPDLNAIAERKCECCGLAPDCPFRGGGPGVPSVCGAKVIDFLYSWDSFELKWLQRQQRCQRQCHKALFPSFI